MKLISMTSFVLEHLDTGYSQEDALNNNMLILKYAKFLKQPLKLEMFVPCVENEPFCYSRHGNKSDYEQAKTNVLFDGFEYVKHIDDGDILPYHRLEKDSEYWNIRFSNRNIETLLSEFEQSFELTESALKQIGLNS